MRLQQDLDRQRMLSDLHNQVRYIKNNYLNQMEEKEKKAAAKQATLAKKLAAEAAELAEVEGGN